MRNLVYDLFFARSYSCLPRLVATYIQLGLAQFLMPFLHKIAATGYHDGEYAQAEKAYWTILRLRPDDRLAVLALADMYRFLDRSDESCLLLEDWLQRFPEDADAHLLLAEQCAEADFDKAIREVERAGQASGACSCVVSRTYGTVHRINGDLSASSRFFRLALEEHETAATLICLAKNLIDEDQRDLAVELLERAISLNPDFGVAYLILARCKQFENPADPIICLMRNKIANGRLPAKDRELVHFAFGDSLDKLGLWDEAFANFKAGNELNKRRFECNLSSFSGYLEQRIQVFEPKWAEAISRKLSSGHEKNMIFVVGMPRSGSTLVEQILASHPEVHPGGERKDIPNLIDHIVIETKEVYPACVRGLDQKRIAELIEPYIVRVANLAGRKRFFVDKALGNWYELGLIVSFFPDARIVHCQRDPLDTCVSCYVSPFDAVRYANDLKTLGCVYRQYHRMMAHWNAVFPGRILNVEYENLVRNPAVHIRELLKFCCLPWRGECLKPHETKRVVLTMSAGQVNQPIYLRSIGRWKRYRKYLGPLIEALGPDLAAGLA